MTEQILVSRRDGLIEADVDGEIVALHVELGTCFGFNKTATRVWQFLETPKTREQLCELLLREYEVSPEQCSADLDRLLEAMRSEGLIDIEPR